MGQQQSADLAPPRIPMFERPLPAELAGVALIDAATAAAAASLSLTTWFELVRTGKAPAPAFRGTRCTRWRLLEVVQWLAAWRGMADEGAAGAGAAPTTPAPRMPASATKSQRRRLAAQAAASEGA